MAVIGKIRKHSALLVIAIGVAMFAFIAGDFFKTSPRQDNNIGVINGEEISYFDFSKKVDENTEIEKRNKQKESLTALESFNVRETTWRQILYNTLMDSEYEKLGLVVSTDELDELVRGQNPHNYIVQIFTNPQTGQFDRQRLMGLMEALRINEVDQATLNWWVSVEKGIKLDRQRVKYHNLIEDGYYMPSKFAEKIYYEKQNEAIIRVISQKYHTISDSLFPVSQAEMEKYYDEHKGDYMQQESIDLDYVIFDILPSEDDYKHAQEDVQEIYQEFLTATEIPTFVNATSDRRYDSTWYKANELPVMMDSTMFNSPIGTFIPPYFEDNSYYMAKLMDIDYRPDSMKASHILISYSGAFRAPQETTRIKVDASRLADSIFQAVKNNPQVFENLVTEFSNDPSALQNNGDLGWFADGTMIYPFNEAVVNGKTGSFYMVESPFGYHIVKVTGKKEDVKKVRVAIIQRDVLPSSKTYKDIYNTASVFAGENNTAEKFEQAVIDQGLAKRSVQKVTKMYNNIPGIDYPREIIRWAYSNNTREGDVSAQPFELEGKYVIALVKAHYNEGPIPLKDATLGIENIIRKQKKAAYLIDRMNSLDGDINQMAAEIGTKTDTVTVTFGSMNVPGIGREPAVVAAAFTLETGVLSEPIEGKAGVYRIITDQLLKAEGTSDYSPFVQVLFEQFKEQVQTEAPYKAIEKESDIIDNRVLYY